MHLPNDSPHRRKVKTCRSTSFWRSLICIWLVVSGASCQPDSESVILEEGLSVADASRIETQVKKFCGDCHAVPSPESFPRDAWHREVTRGFEFYNVSGRSDLEIPRKADIVRWYRRRAEPNLKLDVSSGVAGSVDFRAEKFSFSESLGETGTAGLTIIDGTGGREVYLTDMLKGVVGRFAPTASKERLTALFDGGNPCRIEPTDLDQDGVVDYLVADLGSPQPEDHDRGRVLWARELAGQFRIDELACKLGRVADIRPADFDDDGDLDLVVAEFGWLQSGRILLLENTAEPTSQSVIAQASWKQHVVDPRHGTIHVPVVDLNADGLLDFVALVSQEHEAVDAFLNQGGLKFKKVRIWAAPDPSYGSSGIELADLDDDGDIDVLYCNGDTFDSFYLKPYHGIRWLENQGEFPFRSHELTKMPGVSKAVPVDLDGDGDLDIAACGIIPWAKIRTDPNVKLDSLLWLENDGNCIFTSHSLEQARQGHLAMAAGDLDGDGDADLAVGGFGKPESGEAELPSVTVWWNLSVNQ